MLKIKRIFPNERMNEQYKVNKYFIDLVFPVHKLGIEIYENGHTDRPKAVEKKRSKIIKEETGFEIIRINPDKENLISLMKLVKYKYLFLAQIKN